MKIAYTDTVLPHGPEGLDFIVNSLDAQKGVYMASDTEYPGRYSRWDLGFDAPPVEVIGFEKRVEFRALDARGERMLDMFAAMPPDAAFTMTRVSARLLACDIAVPARAFAEEERSRQPSPLSPLRHVIKNMEGADAFAGFYGAFKYDLLFCFNPMPLKHARGEGYNLFHVYIPDSIHIYDRRKEVMFRRDYEFSAAGVRTEGLPRAERKHVKTSSAPVRPADIASNMTDAEYGRLVSRATEHIRKGDVFEIVFSRKFSTPAPASVSQLFRNIRRVNPSPYEFLIQMGDEQLVGASPEMFVRVEGRRVESCPIAGTARRSRAGGQAAVMEDARIQQDLLNSAKDEAELTMCTDVDRNDKARICVPGSVRVIGRRQMEAYAGLFHTVDHVEGTLRDGFDGIDAFLSHMWAVTLTGAPKLEAVRIIENCEAGPREYYGAAVGALCFGGGVNTGITIRTLHLKNGVASYQVGASLVYDSVPEEEAAETHTKATSFKRILSGEMLPAEVRRAAQTGAGKTAVLIDNEDSFVQTLADYIRQTGATALTYRHGTPLDVLLKDNPHLVVHSPGPGLPSQFRVPETVRALAERKVPQFGVCLGLQGIFEAFGGTLGYLQKPHHGKTWSITHTAHRLFDGVPSPCTVGAYHSIHGLAPTLPKDLEVTASNENGVIMAVAHKTLPVWAVQFHPESVLSLKDDAGMKMVENVMKHLARA